MGFFDVIKKNITQGGVDVQLLASPQVPNTGVYTFAVRLTAKKEPQVIKRINAIIERYESTALRRGPNTGQQNEQRRERVAQVESTEQFTLNAGETRDVQLSLSLNGAAIEGARGAGVLGQAMGRLGRLGGNANFIFELYATADVEGVLVDPADRQKVQIIDAPATQGQMPTQAAPTVAPAQQYQQSQVQPQMQQPTMPPQQPATPPVAPVAQPQVQPPLPPVPPVQPPQQ